MPTILPVLHTNYNEGRSDSEKANLLNNYFKSVFSAKSRIPSFDFTYKSECDFHTSARKVMSIFKNLDVCKATGEDGVPNCLLIFNAESLAKSLSLIFNKSKQTGIFSDQWNIAKVISIFKKRYS